jgi:hypothetical protein
MHCHTLVLPVDVGIDGVGKAAGQDLHAVPATLLYFAAVQAVQVVKGVKLS